MEHIQIQDKKGMSIGDLYPAILTILMIGLILGVGLYILSTFHDTVAIDYSGTQDAINTSTGTTTLTDAALAEFYTDDLTAELTNGTASTNFTYTSAGVISWGTELSTDQADSLVNVTYTYNYDASNSPEEAMTTTISGIATFADWIAIIVVVIAAAIVLGIVLTSFGRKRNTI